MEIEEIKAIVELMSKHNLSEFKVEAENMRLSLKRELAQGAHTQVIPQSQHQAPIIAPAVHNHHPSHIVAESAKSAATVSSSTEEKSTINAPIVGTFYPSPSPEADSFVKIGDKVQADTIVCIIEAMKVMNEIKAEKAGVIKEILVKNGQSVEYGCPLFVIE